MQVICNIYYTDHLTREISTYRDKKIVTGSILWNKEKAENSKYACNVYPSEKYTIFWLGKRHYSHTVYRYYTL